MLKYHVSEVGENPKYEAIDRAVAVIPVLTELLRVLDEREEKDSRCNECFPFT